MVHILLQLATGIYIIVFIGTIMLPEKSYFFFLGIKLVQGFYSQYLIHKVYRVIYCVCIYDHFKSNSNVSC